MGNFHGPKNKIVTKPNKSRKGYCVLPGEAFLAEISINIPPYIFSKKLVVYSRCKYWMVIPTCDLLTPYLETYVMGSYCKNYYTFSIYVPFLIL